MQDDTHPLIRGDGIDETVHPEYFVYHDISFVCKKNANQTVCEIYLLCFLLRNLLWCTP